MSKPAWFPVSERLPKIGVSVLCSSPEPPGNDGVWIGQREEYGWYLPGANEMGTPTHWMPLPEPPHAEPLYRSPTLTDAEREAIGWAIAATAGVSLRAETLRGLLERTAN
jgi:hypothetical protein